MHPSRWWSGRLKKRGIPCGVSGYPFLGAGRAQCMGNTDGLVTLVIDSDTDRVLGAHIIGPRAEDMIAECVISMEFDASSEDIARTDKPHGCSTPWSGWPPWPAISPIKVSIWSATMGTTATHPGEGSERIGLPGRPGRLPRPAGRGDFLRWMQGVALK
ncbi:MAG: hypothetical protein JRG88_13140 [Deltaproteobacteria bacterium]|nr:hypothetical protein [Deltaproteobacteria bacterium]